LILNIYILRENKVKEKDIISIYRKIYNSFNVNSFCKMVTNDKGYIVSVSHFEVDDLIKEIKEFLKECRSCFVKRNEKLLDILEKVKIKIISDNKGLQ